MEKCPSRVTRWRPTLPHVRFDEGRVETGNGSSGLRRWEETTIKMLRNLPHGATLLLYAILHYGHLTGIIKVGGVGNDFTRDYARHSRA